MTSTDMTVSQIAQALKERQAVAAPVLAQVQQFTKEIYAGFTDVLAALVKQQAPGVIPAQVINVGEIQRLRFAWHGATFLLAPEPGVAFAPEELRPHLAHPVGRVMLYRLQRDDERYGTLFRDYYIDTSGGWGYLADTLTHLTTPFWKTGKQANRCQ